jgi:hypothetical protein
LLRSALVPARLGIAYTTARTHLLQIFQKTGTARQTALVRLMLDRNEGSIVDQPRRVTPRRPDKLR